MGSPLPPSEVSSLVRHLRSAGRWVARAVRADHTTLYALRCRVDAGRMRKPYVHVALAPSRRVRRPLDGDFPVAARRFVRSVFGEVFPNDPVLSTRDLVRFQVPPDLGEPMDFLVEISPSGLVEILWIIPVEELDDDHFALPIEAVGRTVSNLAQGVHGGAYRLLFRRPFFARWKRVDWFVNVTGTWSDEGYKEWTEVVFPGRPPKSRATGHRSFSPVNGYGTERLRGKRQGTDDKKIVERALDDFLRENGFLEYRLALEDSVSAASSNN